MEQRAVKKPIALHVFWPRVELDTAPRERTRGKAKGKSIEEQAKERRARQRATEDFFEEAKAYARAKDAAANGSVSPPERIPAWEAMLPYVRGDLPIMVHADEVRQINAAVNWASTNDYKIILAGGRDAWMTAGLLAEKKIPVVYAHTFTQPTRDTEPYDVHFKAPGVLSKAGVRVAFGLAPEGFNAPLVRNLPYARAACGGGRPPRFHRSGQRSDAVGHRWRPAGHPSQGETLVDCRQGSQPRKPAYAAVRQVQEPPKLRVNGDGSTSLSHRMGEGQGEGPCCLRSRAE